MGVGPVGSVMIWLVGAVAAISGRRMGFGGGGILPWILELGTKLGDIMLGLVAVFCAMGAGTRRGGSLIWLGGPDVLDLTDVSVGCVWTGDDFFVEVSMSILMRRLIEFMDESVFSFIMICLESICVATLFHSDSDRRISRSLAVNFL